MAQGTVKWFNSVKGFGCIAAEGSGPDVFVHSAQSRGAGAAASTRDSASRSTSCRAKRARRRRTSGSSTDPSAAVCVARVQRRIVLHIAAKSTA
jgi:hypothetical protein